MNKGSRIIIYALAILVFSGGQSFAEEAACPGGDKVLIDESIQGSTLKLRQHNLGWCYAFAGVVSVSQLLKKQISVLDFAIQHTSFLRPAFKMTGRDGLTDNAGSSDEDINTINEGLGFCPASVLPLTEYGVPFAQKNSPSSLIVRYTWNTELSDLIAEITQRCDGQRLHLPGDAEIKLYTVRSSQVPEPSEQLINGAFDVIDQQLDQNLIPVISADMKFFEWASKGTKDHLQSGLHAVNVVGRKYNPEIHQCEYLIRDSYELDQGSKLASPRYDSQGYLHTTKEQLKAVIRDVTFWYFPLKRVYIQ